MAGDKGSLVKQRADIIASNKTSSLDRYRFLLGKTNLFEHFLSKGQLESIKSPTSEGRSGKKTHGIRKSEKEEDEELLNDELKEGETLGETFDSSPNFIHGTMRDYQIHGLNWLIQLYEHGINGILADEMGLGKTLQTISFIGYLRFFKETKGPHLILVPKSTLQNWVNEFNKWIPDIKVFLFQGDKDTRKELIENKLFEDNWDVLITSYELVMIEQSSLKKFPWQYIVIDEAHRIKNENSLLSKVVRLFTCRNRLLITGTPLQNNLKELWALLNFLLPDIFTTYEEFDSYLQGNGQDQDQVVHQLHAVLRPFLLRRLKADVEKSLLPKKRINLYVGMSEMQRQWYQKILSKDVEAINGVTKDNKEGKTRLLNIVMQLRKCCNHPYLFDGAEPGPPYTTDIHLVQNSGKLSLIDKLLVSLQAKGSRVLIFSQMSRVLDILEDYLIWRNYEYCRIDGSTPHEDRIKDIDEFNAEGSKKFVFLLTTRAGGLGINLATADTVIMFDNDWNPQVDLQAEDRAHRIGQKKQVHIFRLVTENSIEEKVLERAASKLRLDQLVIQQGRVVQQTKSLGKDELVSMIQHGADVILAGKNSILEDESVEDIIKKGERLTAKLEEKFDTLGLGDLEKFTLEPGSMYQFEGKDFSNAKNKGTAGFSMEWFAPAKREKKIGGYSIDDYYRQQLSTSTKTAEPRQPRPPKHINVSDHQFFPPRVSELQKKELYWYWKDMDYKFPRGEFVEGGPSEEELEAKRVEEQEKIDNAEPLSDKEKEELELLKSQGFVNCNSGNKRDFHAFIRGCEKYTRNNFEDITTEVEGKTLEEVKAYSLVFWERYREIAEHEGLIDRIEKGEEKIRKRDVIQEQLSAIVQSYKFPYQQLQIPYGNTQKGKNYTEEEDRFMIVQLEKHGVSSEDVYDVIRKSICQHPNFRFDWYIKSRTAIELQRRCQTLINLLTKDVHEGDEDVEYKKSGKRRGAGNANSVSVGGSGGTKKAKKA